jgi:putative methyltransferase (TIGR04325 family)
VSLNNLIKIAKVFIPPIFLAVYRRLCGKGIRFEGHYESWKDAALRSTGYDADLILNKVSDAITKVKNGEAVFERDSVLFDKVEHSFPLLAALLRIAVEHHNRLDLLDFGGSLGSSYFQCKYFLPDNLKLNWCVIEQKNFVDRGREAFSSEELHFFSSIAECGGQYKPHVILFASVLQYLEKIDQIIDEAIATGAQYIVIDRTPFHKLPSDWLCVQKVPADIYNASYPCAILSESRLHRYLAKHFELIAEFDALGGKGHVQAGLRQIPFEYKGMIWRKR